ncbi:uncharacterized protein METZ01_LOCUS269260 [marine metagenome]|uniref:Uncharacterized protein n=1 Tax=marine metagenome TaxID=408172 RepID=A0A382JXH0_9ZZZZ
MRYISNITGLYEQPLHNHNLHVGQWVRTGKSGKMTAKGVFMGTILGKPVFVQDFGESRPIFMQRMHETRELVKLANQLFDRVEFVD